jgi:hypothetical protein
MKLPRVLRAIAGTAAIWGLAWSLLSVLVLLYMLVSDRDGDSAAQSLWTWATHVWMWFAQGAFLGASFAALLHGISRRATWCRMLTLPIVGVLGAVASGTVGALVWGSGSRLLAGLVLGGVGAATAMISLGIARRAPSESIDESVPAARISAV